MTELGRDEFENWMQVLREDIRGVHNRLDNLNGRTGKNERDIAVLQDRGDQAKDQHARYVGYGSALVTIALNAWQSFHR